MDEVNVTPEEAKFLALKDSTDPNGPYLNLQGTFSRVQQDIAIARVNRYQMIAAGLEPDIDGFVDELVADKEDQLRDIRGPGFGENKSSNSNDL